MSRGKDHFLLLLIFLLIGSSQAVAQHLKGAAYAREASSIVSRFKRDLQSLRKNAAEVKADTADTDMSPYLYRLFGPGVYYHSVLAGKFQLTDVTSAPAAPMLSTPLIDERQQTNDYIDNVLFGIYAENPSFFHYSDAQINAVEGVDHALDVGAKKEDLTSIYNKVDEIKQVTDVVDNVEVDIQITKPNFWTTKGKFSLQFTQNYFSENWYKGGNNNVSLLSNLVLEANYNDQRSLQWDNKLDLRLGFLTATSDSIHRYLTNNDKIYLLSKLGVKAAKNWYYTFSVEANTQFLPGHKANDRRTYSKFLAPLDVYVSLGMDWKPKLKNGNTLSLALLPFSYKMRYISDEEEAIHSSYKMVGKDFQQDFGSKIEFNSNLTIVKNLTWRCRFYYFTSYEYAESELENLFSFRFNKYISSEVYTLWRFDDNRDKKYYDHTLGYFQFKEYFTLGLAYNF